MTSIVEADEIQSAGPERVEEQLFLFANQRAEDADFHSPQSSSSSGAGATSAGSTLMTSRSRPQSGHWMISPTSVDDSSVISASHCTQRHGNPSSEKVCGEHTTDGYPFSG
jgi:hypothetical protein